MRIKSLLLIGILAAPLAAQDLVVRRPDGTETRLSAAEFGRLPDTAFSALDHGKPTRFRGVSMRTLLARSGGIAIDSLRGPALRRVLVLRGADGYSAVIALADLDTSIGGTPAFIVTSQDGAPLSAEHGPYRAVIVGDARGARWVRQLVRLEVVELH